MKHEFHEFASMFPLLEGPDLEEFIADIKANGQRELIVMLDDKVLDGRNRYIACQKLGIAPRLRDLNCLDGDPLEYVWSQNVNRRHLTAAQRAMAIAKRSNFVENYNAEIARIGAHTKHGQAEQADAVRRQTDRIMTERQAAQIAGVSAKQIGRAKAVLKHGTPQEIALIERGKAGLWKAAHVAIKRSEGNEEEPDLTERSGAGGYTKVQIPAGYTPEEYTRHGLALEAKGVEPSSVFKKLHIADDSYRKMREIVMISDLDYLREQDRKIADLALKTLNQTGQVVRAYPLIEPISQKVWGNLKKNSQTAQNRINEFEKQVEIIAHVCESKLDVPYLNQTQASETVERLNSAVSGVKKLITEIKDFYNV